MSLQECTLLDLPKITDSRGNLTVIENCTHIPFDIKRIFYIYGLPTAASRGAHAHRESQQFIICLSGHLDICLNDGVNKKIIHLSTPSQGLYIPTMVWAEENNFAPGTIYLVLASDYFNEEDYFRDYKSFLLEVSKKC